MSEIPTCPRHPDVETRLSCSACDEPICPACGREAAVGYKCPDCARQNEATQPRAGTSVSPFQRLLQSLGAGAERRSGSGDPDGGGSADAPSDEDAAGDEPASADEPPARADEPASADEPAARRSDGASEDPGTDERSGWPSPGAGGQLPMALGARATVVGGAVAIVAGLLVGPVMAQGAFFLISAGVLGWLVARSVYWASEEHDSPYLRALAMTAALAMVLIGHVTASSGPDAVRELALLAYPAALYGGWIVVRQR